MNRALFIRAITRFFAGLVLVALLLFIPAGTWKYPGGLLLMGILFIPMFIAGLIMMKKNPELFKKRLSVKEEESEQREVILFSGIMFLAAFIMAGLSFRNGWLLLSFSVSVGKEVCGIKLNAGLVGIRNKGYSGNIAGCFCKGMAAYNEG